VSAAEERVEPADPVQRLVEAVQSPFSAPDFAVRLTTIFERDEARAPSSDRSCTSTHAA